VNLPVEELRKLSEGILARRGLSDPDAAVVTDILLEAELRGRPSHGMIRLPGIAERSAGRTPMRLAREGPSYALVDGQENLGYLVAHRCARTIIGKAETTGLAVVGGFNTGHCGMLGYYASMVADAGMIGLAACDTSPRIAPWGGTQPVLGTNPLAAGFPARKGQVLVDLSSAAITNGQILMHMKDGTPLPEGVALGTDGKLTTDPEAALAGAVLPFGGHKGYALAVMIQILSGALVRAAPVPQPGRNYGIFLLAISPTIFMDANLFHEGVEDLIRKIKGSEPAAGVGEVLVPGERAFRERARRLTDGIEIDLDLMAELRKL
jgi:L-2-hydroxycarboxylate dehydrogenase (NAD+)